MPVEEAGAEVSPKSERSDEAAGQQPSKPVAVENNA
jgi:hypothetical protein